LLYKINAGHNQKIRNLENQVFYIKKLDDLRILNMEVEKHKTSVIKLGGKKKSLIKEMYKCDTTHN